MFIDSLPCYSNQVNMWDWEIDWVHLKLYKLFWWIWIETRDKSDDASLNWRLSFEVSIWFFCWEFLVYKQVPWGQTPIYVWGCDDWLLSCNFVTHLYVFLIIFGRICLSFRENKGILEKWKKYGKWEDLGRKYYSIP